MHVQKHRAVQLFVQALLPFVLLFFCSGDAPRQHQAKLQLVGHESNERVSESWCAQVLVWSGNFPDDFVSPIIKGVTWYSIFDTAGDIAGPAQSVNVSHDMFCPGIAQLPNGNIFVVAGSGGGDGASSSSTWTGDSFVMGPPLNIARGYNSALTLSSGNVCIFFVLVLLLLCSSLFKSCMHVLIALFCCAL
jgi:hypothetical protein